MKKLFVVFILTQLGTKPWCSVLPNTQEHCHAGDKKDCDGKESRYCIWDSHEECEKNKIYSEEKCVPNDNFLLPHSK